MTLKRLTIDDEAVFFQALEAFPSDKNFSFVPSFNWEGMSFIDILDKITDYENGIGLPEGFVPDTLLFAFNDDGAIVGRSSIRHRLTEFLEKYGGHIGYGVVPQFRKQGYATKILKESLTFSKDELGLKRVLITCDDTNTGSIKTIENNGITQFTLFNDSNLAVPKRHYWVDL